MKIAPKPENENQRLEALLSYKILDSNFEKVYDELTALASYICETPIALISLVDRDRRWFKSVVGLPSRETPRDIAFCSHAILHDNIFIINDALQDERFVDNPLVIQNPNIRFYAGAPLITNDGFALGTLCAIDVVPRQLNEKQTHALSVLAKQTISQLELRLSVQKLAEFSNQLREINASRDKLFSIISHDLKGPFTGILGFADILLTDYDQLDKKEVLDFIQMINDSSRSTLKLLENLLEWSLLERGIMSFEPKPMDFSEIIKEVISVLAANISNKNIQIISRTNTPLLINADKKMVFSLLQNLVSNAIKFSPIGGKIEIDVQSLEHHLEVSVSDDGIGINADQIENLFKVECTSSTKGTAGETGTGLGLLLCKNFVEKHGGKIWVESEEGKGSRFMFALPSANQNLNLDND